MKIKLLFFGATADIIGEREIELDYENAPSTKTVLSGLTTKFPALTNHGLLSAVNHEYVAPDTILSDGDELAVFTPVSGG